MSTVSDQYLAFFPEFSSEALQGLPSERIRTAGAPALRLFLAHYTAFPCVSKCPKVESNASLHVSSILTYLKDQFGHDLTCDIISREYHDKSKKYYVKYVLKEHYSRRKLIIIVLDHVSSISVMV